MISLTSQLSALRRLNSVDQDLKILDKRLNTGVKVADVKDSTSAVSAARSSSSRSAAFSTVQSSLDLGIATVSIASAAVTTASSLIGNIRDLLEAAKDGNADLASIQAQLTAERSKLRSTVTGAMFKGVNLLASSTSISGYLGAPKDAAGSAYSIGVDRNRTRLLDTLGTTGILQRTFALSSGLSTSSAPSTLGLSGSATQTGGGASSTPTTAGLSETASSVNGLAANSPATTGLSGAASTVAGVTGTAPATTGLSGTTATVAGVAATAAGTAKAYVGTLDSASFQKGDTVNLTTTLNGVTKTVKVYQRSVSSSATLQTELQRAVNAEFGSGVITARVEADNRISLETVASGSGQSIAVTGVAVADGDDVTTSTLALQSQSTYSTVTKTINGGVHMYDSLNAFSLTGLDKTDQLQFKVDFKEDGGTAFNYTINVKLANVTDGASLVTAINQQISGAGFIASYMTAAYWDGTNVLFYEKADEGGIKVSQITAINGDGTVAGNLGFATGSATSSAGAATSASATTGSDFSGPVTLQSGSSLNFDVTVNGTTRTVAISKATVEAALTGQSGYTAGSGTIADINQLMLVAQRALADQSVSGVTASASGNRLKFTMSTTPANGDAINVSNAQATSGTSTVATLTTGSDFVGPRTIASNSSLDFTLTVDGVATNISVTKADVETALAGRLGHTNGSGTIADTTELALSVQAAMTRQGLSGVTVAASGNKLKFTKTATGSGTIAISGITGSSTATNAIATTGSDFTSPITVPDGGAITFDVAIDGNAAQTIRIEKSTVEAALIGVSGRTSGTGTIANVSELAMVAQRALADGGVSVITVGTSGNRLTFTRTAAGAGSVAVSNTQAVASSAAAAALRTGSDFAGPVTIDPGASIGFDLSVDGVAVTRVTIQHSTVETALAGVSGRTAGTGIIGNVSEFALVVQRALVEASISGVTVAADGNRIKFSKTATGAGQIAIGGLVSTAATVTTASTTTIDSINVNSTGFAGLSISQRQSLLSDYIGNIDLIAKCVVQAASHLNFVGKQLEIQSKHTGKLQGIEAGRVGNMVNADMTAEEARRNALEVRLVLARKSIEIVNQSRKNVLNIFD